MIIEESLAQTNNVRNQLLQKKKDLQHELDALREELKRNQDPDKMQLIQEMISVRGTFSGSIRTDIELPYRNCLVKCHEYARRLRNLKPL